MSRSETKACCRSAQPAIVPYLSPMLIFGLGPLPAFGVAGAATAVLLYYAAGSLCFALYLWGGGGILQPSARPPRLSWAPFREILRVGGMSALVSATTNLTIAIITSYVGTAGVAALAGYGAGARLEFKILKCKTIKPMPGRTS